MSNVILEFHHRERDTLDAAARRLLRASPELLHEAMQAEPSAHTAAGSVLAMRHGRARWAAEHYVMKAVEALDKRMQGGQP